MGKKCKSSSSSSSSSCEPSSYKPCSCKSSSCKSSSCFVSDKCAPIYYPNNFVGPYPCGPFPPPCPPPCPPPYLPPCPLPRPPCPPNFQSCGTPYTSNPIIGTSSSILLNSTSPNVNIFNTTTQSITVTLPAITTLINCNYTKMFVITNLSGSSNTLTISTSSLSDIFTSTGTQTSAAINSGETVTLYAVYTSQNSTNYWVLQA